MTNCSINKTIDPATKDLNQVLNYKGVEFHRWSSTCKNFKRAFPVVAGSVLAFFLLSPLAEQQARSNIFGVDGKGGKILEVKTIYKEGDLAYGREFQRMRYLIDPIEDRVTSSRETEQYLIDRGVSVEGQSRTDLRKKAPHFKYF